MWSGFDPQLRRDLDWIREMVALQPQTPTREWPLVWDEELAELLVVREWPDGSVTAYFASSKSPGFQDPSNAEPSGP
jgi:hypothetical protein